VFLRNGKGKQTIIPSVQVLIEKKYFDGLCFFKNGHIFAPLSQEGIKI
jgi:hypothetical protein